MEALYKISAGLYQARRKLATLGVGVLAVLLAWHVLFGANGMVAYQHKRAEYRALQNEMEGLQAENERLQRQIQGLRSDPKTIEREAREQLRYARPGEVIYTLPQPSEVSQPQQTISAQKR